MFGCTETSRETRENQGVTTDRMGKSTTAKSEIRGKDAKTPTPVPKPEPVPVNIKLPEFPLNLKIREGD